MKNQKYYIQWIAFLLNAGWFDWVNRKMKQMHIIVSMKSFNQIYVKLEKRKLQDNFVNNSLTIFFKLQENGWFCNKW